MYSRSQQLFEKAQKSIPGGVNSPVRAFRSVGGTPIFIKSARGAYLYDEDDNQYIDYINSWGPMILGHAYAPVVDAVKAQLEHSLSYGAPTSLETEMAELIKSMVPGIDMIRMVNSGTEACMSALRLARAFTGKNKLIKFDGCYHGHADSFLVSAGSGVATLDIQVVPGITNAVAEYTLTAPYNDLDAVEKLFIENKNEIAAIIIEPVAGNMGCIPPGKNFLLGLRSLCDKHNALLIFDEVMTGFRLAPGGAQEIYDIKADIVTFGKIIGGGLPVGAYAARKEIMQQVAPSGKVYQAGTLSGNPLAMRAGYTLLKELKENNSIYTQLESRTELLERGLLEAFKEVNQPVQINRVGSMISVHFSAAPVTDFRSAASANNELFKQYFHHCLRAGIYLPPSAFETWFISSAISEEHIAHTVSVTREFLKTI